MRYKTLFITALLSGALLLAGCAGGQAQTPGEDAPDVTRLGSVEDGAVYRGAVTTVQENGDFIVSQLAGYNYGHESILFHLPEGETAPEGLVYGAYVQVGYNGLLTRSLPPQGTTDDIEIISSFSEGIVQNGEITQVEKTDDGYTIYINTLEALADASQVVPQTVILQVPADALEGITAEELVPGAQVSAVTRGIAALSLPPQMPVVVLLPYNP